MINVVTVGYCQALGAPAANAQTSLLATYIAAATRRIERWTGRKFYARRYAAERYDAGSWHSLSLRHAPLVGLNLVTMFPDGPSPQVFQPASFDVDYEQARLTFVYNQNGTFLQRMANRGNYAAGLADIVEVDSFAGYGWYSPLSAALPAGTNQVIPLISVFGRVPGQGPWNAADATQIVLDSDTSTAETISVSWNGTALVGTTNYAHAAGSFASGSLVPEDVQLAAGTFIQNLLNVGDLTKQEEMIGRLGGYTYQQRKGNAIWTAEIVEMLEPYREIIV